MIVAGQLPVIPVGQLLGLRFAEVDEGRVVVALRTSNWLRSRSLDEVASGVVAFLGRGAMGLSGATLCPTSHRPGILESNLSFLRPAPVDGQELLARAHVSYEAGGLLISTGEVIDADGNVVAVGRQTALRIERRRRTSPGAEPERVLATVLFTDIVGSTRRAEELGDAAWGRLLAEHHDAVRSQLEIWKGKEVKTTGDGFLATFDSPARAVQCARSVRDVVRRLGLEIRAGIHTGECEVTKTDVAGIAVHVAARIQALAEPGEVLVSSTVRDLVAGSGLRFFDRDRHELKGIEGEWQLFALVE
jgi:class 3 adenylate cyclase